MSPHLTPIPRSIQNQSGVVLIASLLILLLLSVISLSGVQSTGLEEKMTSNVRYKNLAFQAAEGALQAGEKYIQNLNNEGITAGFFVCPSAGINDGLMNDEPKVDAGIDSVWSAGGDWCADDPATTKCSAKTGLPKFVVQCLSEQGVYRITAHAKGSTPDTVVVLQSIYSLKS